ncbi:hypothetical protein C8F04DRAFT_1153708 [Mycena alexandri]|uniref:Uncharacterized protein n=1 Tax=Mycena alexandri TaxID=1745969 RepID=A0AAD6S0E6_9AGAR|nr:hypothetical protein C8F04DRAFT_1153708 [Mycena alexandri]
MLLSRTARRVPHRPASTSVASLSTLPLSRSNLPQIFTHSRGYALSVTPSKSIKGMSLPRHFQGKKAFQYNWYTKILESSTTSPLIFLYHNDFTAQKLIKLRRDISAASNLEALIILPISRRRSAEPVAEPAHLTGALAVLSLPVLDPPQLKAILRTFDRNVPPRKPKTEEELQKELQEKNADPANPGLDPELRFWGRYLTGKYCSPERVRNLVGLLSSPGAQLAMVLSEAGGGRLARTLEGLKKGLEETSGEVSGDVPPP